MDFPNRDLTFPEDVFDWKNIDTFYRWLTLHPKWVNITSAISSRVRDVMQMVEKIHYLDKRNDGTAYMYHPVRVSYASVARWGFISPNAIMTRIAHDTLEDHPKNWREIFQTMWLQGFRNILALATGWFWSHDKEWLEWSICRKEMIEFFLEKIETIEQNISPENRKYIESGAIFRKSGVLQEYSFLRDIIRMLNPVDPIHKAKNDSIYAHNLDSQDSYRIQAAIAYYRNELIISGYQKKGKVFTGEDEGYIGLWNYLFFTEYNCRDKLEDVLDNMTDMKKREETKPWSIKKRRIKAYILWIKLKNLWMMDEYSRLSKAFSDAGYTMLQDAEVFTALQESYTSSELH